MDNDIFYELYNYLEERHHNNIYQNAKQDADYLKTTQLEKELNNQYESLDLSAEQRNIIDRWIDAIHAQESAYNAVVFRMAMQCCFFDSSGTGRFEVIHEKSGVFHSYTCWNISATFFTSLMHYDYNNLNKLIHNIPYIFFTK